MNRRKRNVISKFADMIEWKGEEMGSNFEEVRNSYLKELCTAIKKNNEILVQMMSDRNLDSDVISRLQEENENLRELVEKNDAEIENLRMEIYRKDEEIWWRKQENAEMLKSNSENMTNLQRENNYLRTVVKFNENRIKSFKKEIAELQQEKLVDTEKVADFKNNTLSNGMQNIDNKVDCNKVFLIDEEKQKEECERRVKLKHKPSKFWETNAYARKQMLEDYENMVIEDVMTKWNYQLKSSITRVIKQIKAIEEKEVKRVEIKPMDVSNIKYKATETKIGDCNLTINLRLFRANHGLSIKANDADGSKYWIEITGDTILFKDELRRVFNEKTKDKELSSIRLFYKANKNNIPAWHIVCAEEELKTAFDILYNTNPYGYEVNRKYTIELLESNENNTYTLALNYDLNTFENTYHEEKGKYIVKVMNIEKELSEQEFKLYYTVKKYEGKTPKYFASYKYR